MKPVILFIILVSFIASCRPIYSVNECREFNSLRCPIVKKGYITDSAIGEIYFERKWRAYENLSKECIIELLGEPVRIEKNVLVYYVVSDDGEGPISIARFYFRWGKFKRIRMTLA